MMALIQEGLMSFFVEVMNYKADELEKLILLRRRVIKWVRVLQLLLIFMGMVMH